MKKLSGITALLFFIPFICHAQHVSPGTFGAKGDGKQDDLPAINAAIKYCRDMTIPMLVFNNGIYRLTDQIIAGEKFADESDASLIRILDTNHAKSFKISKYTAAARALPLIIRGSGQTLLYADFDSRAAKAVIYYSAKGDKRNPDLTEQENGEISNLAICTRGYINDSTGRPVRKALNKKPANKLIGIVALFSYGLKIMDVTFLGLDKGVVQNNCYFSYNRNNNFQWCNDAWDFVYCEGSRFENTRTYFCKTGLTVRSSNCSIDTYISEHCGAALHIVSSYTTVTSCYLETLEPTGAQLTIGLNPGDKDYSPKYISTGNVFTGLTIAVIKASSEKAYGIEFRETARKVIFLSGSAQSAGLITYKNPLTRAVVGDFACNSFPKEIVRRLIPD